MQLNLGDREAEFTWRVQKKGKERTNGIYFRDRPHEVLHLATTPKVLHNHSRDKGAAADELCSQLQANYLELKVNIKKRAFDWKDLIAHLWICQIHNASLNAVGRSQQLVWNESVRLTGRLEGLPCMSSVLLFDARGGPEGGALDWELKDSWEISCGGEKAAQVSWYLGQ